MQFDEFKKLVADERETLRPDDRWTAFLDDLHATDETPVCEPGYEPSEELVTRPASASQVVDVTLPPLATEAEADAQLRRGTPPRSA